MTAAAQPTLTKATNAPVAGDTFYSYSVDTNGIDSGAAGAAVTWDMSSMIKNDSDTTFYLSCAATPYCDSFPGANLVMLNDSDYAYGISGATGLDLIGAYSDGNVVHFSDYNRVSAFPFTYGSILKDTFATHISVMGFDLFVTGYSSSVADGWGTLKLPNGTFANVLRVQTMLVQKDSVDIMGFPSVSETATMSYNWYMPGFRSPLVTIDYDTLGAGTWYVAEAKYYKATPPVTPPPAGVDELGGVNTGLHIFPNPATDALNLHIPSNAAGATVRITDAAGRQVYVGEHVAGDVRIDVSALAPAMYLLHVSEEGQVPRAARFTVTR